MKGKGRGKYRYGGMAKCEQGGAVTESGAYSHGGTTKEHKAKGIKARPRLDKKARGGGNWIAGAIKHKGSLHKSLGVPQGEKIPEAKLNKAAHSSNPKLRKRAALAKTLKGLPHK